MMMATNGNLPALDGIDDDVLKAYLISRGYANAANALEADVSKLSGSAAEPSLPQKSPSNDGSNAILLEFKEFSSWISNSLDIVKPYLLSLSFAVLVHCYIDLIQLGSEQVARQLLSESRLSSTYDGFVEELQYLSLLTSPDQLKLSEFLAQNPFLRHSVEQRYVVTLSSLASNLLARFLDQQGAIHIAAIVNGKIAIKEVTDDFQHRDYYDLNHFIELPGYTYSTARPATNSKLTLGIPGRGKELAVAQSLSPIFHNVVPVEKGDALTRAWLDRLVRPKAILHSQSKKSRLSNDHKRNVTLFSTSEVLKQVDKDEAAGDPLCPSVLFSTIGNAQDNLISMHIHPNVTQVAAGFSDSMVRVWRLDNSQNLDNPAFGQSLKATAYSWNMNEVLPATKQALTDRHLDAAKETLLDQSSKAISAMSDVRYPCIELKGHSQPVFSVTQDSTERFIMSSSSDQTVRLWDTALLQAVSRYDCLSIPWDVKMHPLDYYFATANRDRSVMLYSTDRQRPVRAMVGHTSDVNTLCWHGNGLYLASGSDDKSARLWDIRKGDCVRILRGCNSPVSSLAISPLGNLLAVAGESGNIYLYDLIASKMLCSLRGHQGAVNSLAFSADGLQVVSGGLDCSVRVWSTLPVFCPEENGIDATLLSSQDQMVCGKLILKPRHSFFTKASPVYHVGYTDKNMVYAGGPCQAASRESGLLWSSKLAAAVKSEQDAAALLRISSAVPSNP